MLYRFIPVLALIGCMGFPEDEEPEEPRSICGDGVVTYGELCDDGNTADGDLCSSTCKIVEQSTVHWRTVDISNLEHSCPAGFDLADVVVRSVIATGDCFPELADCPYTLDGPELTFTAECADGAARVQVVPPHVYSYKGYRVAVRFASSTTGEVYGQTLPTWLHEVTHVTLYEEYGYAHVTWDLRSPADDSLDCGTADIGEVTVKATHESGDIEPTTMTIPCRTLHAFTPPLVHGGYDLELITWRATTKVTGLAIGRRSEVTDPGPIVLTMPM